MATARPLGVSRDRQPRNWWREALVVLGIIAFGLFVLGTPTRVPTSGTPAPVDIVD